MAPCRQLEQTMLPGPAIPASRASISCLQVNPASLIALRRETCTPTACYNLQLVQKGMCCQFTVILRTPNRTPNKTAGVKAQTLVVVPVLPAAQFCSPVDLQRMILQQKVADTSRSSATLSYDCCSPQYSK